MSEPLTTPDTIEVFISYAHEDEELRDELEGHLVTLVRRKMITIWDDRGITAGEKWAGKIDEHLNTAKVILLLVSVYFLKSKYCYEKEFKRAMERHEKGEARVIAVILRPCKWMDTPIKDLQVLPRNAKPVVDWKSRDSAFLSVAEDIEKAVKKLLDIQKPDDDLLDGLETKSDKIDAPPKVATNHVPATGGNKEEITEVVVRINRPQESISEIQITVSIRNDFGANPDKLYFSILSGSVIVVIRGDSEELSRIVEAYRDSADLRQKLAQSIGLESITYTQGGRKFTLQAGPQKKTAWNRLTEILEEAIRVVPPVKYALGEAGIAAAVAIVAGFTNDYRVAVFGTIIMFGFMFCLVMFSSLARYAAASIKPLALTLAWTFVLLTSATSVCIFTGYFFSFPRPLEAYVKSPTPSPTATPTVTAQMSIRITQIPPYDPVGGPNTKAHIAGEVSGVNPENYRVVIYALTNMWYVQPTTAEPLTEVKDGKWSADIQTGTKYAVLLVRPDYNPPYTTTNQPSRLGGVIAAAEVEGRR